MTPYGTVRREWARSDSISGHANNALQVIRFSLELDEPLTPLELLAIAHRLAAIVELEGAPDGLVCVCCSALERDDAGDFDGLCGSCRVEREP